MQLPKLPVKAAYILLNNPARRNALSLAVLEDLRAQLQASLTSPRTGRLLVLPPFQPSVLEDLEKAAAPAPASAPASAPEPEPDRSRHGSEHDPHSWLVDPAAWVRERVGLPDVLVLRSAAMSGLAARVFSSGHDLRELSHLPPAMVRRTFDLCAEVMALVRRSPAPVVCAVRGLATAAGCQLALSGDVVVLGGPDARLQLPGKALGLPCTSPATAVERRLGQGLGLWMLMTGEALKAEDLRGVGGIDVVDAGDGDASEAFEVRVAEVVDTLTAAAAQPAALAKWAYWTQVGMREGGSDGYEEAAAWAGRVMALHARSCDAREGLAAFLEKRDPRWTS